MRAWFAGTGAAATGDWAVAGGWVQPAAISSRPLAHFAQQRDSNPSCARIGLLCHAVLFIGAAWSLKGRRGDPFLSLSDQEAAPIVLLNSPRTSPGKSPG